MMFLGKIMPKKFFSNERIVRHIYTTDHYNETTKKLKSNFVGFTLNNVSKKYELSCNRFEMENIVHCHEMGKINTAPKKEYFGIACTSVSLIVSNENYSLFYSPMYNKEVHLNYSHSDIYDNGLPGIPKHELGETLTASMLLEREDFVKKWKVYSIAESSQKNIVIIA